MSPPCRICGNTDGNTPYRALEMLHGTREPFDYFQCQACGCLQIETIPDDLGRHYPSDYQAYKNYGRRARNSLRHFIDSRRVRHGLTGKGLLGALLNRLSPPLDYVHWCKTMGISPSARILDVGCGNGKLLSRMLAGGFTQLRGIDPFIKEDIRFGTQAEIYKTDLPGHLASKPEPYDLVMLHHSFEHMPDPEQVLAWCAGLMRDDGWLLIRVPLADSLAWQRYREHWFQLDAPRHLYLHTHRSLALLAERCGFVIHKEERDSSATQFSQSELYKRGIPANAPREERAVFSAAETRAFEDLTQEVNRSGAGDQGAFYLKKKR